MRVCTDGYISLEDPRRLRTPGPFEDGIEPVPEREAVAFLLSHTFPGCRRIVRPLSLLHRKQIRRAMWAESVGERMSLLDPVWRGITEPLPREYCGSEPVLVQVALYGGRWAYPLHIQGGTTRVLPQGGLPAAELNGSRRAERIELRTTRRR